MAPPLNARRQAPSPPPRTPPPPPPLVVVGSTNRVKIAAAEAAVRAIFGAQLERHRLTLEVRGVAADSGVADQPVGDDETLRGALNRVATAERAWWRSGGGDSGGGGSNSGSASSGGSGGESGGDGDNGGLDPTSGRPRPWLVVSVEGGVLWRSAAAGGGGGASIIDSASGGGAGGGAELWCMAWAAVKAPGAGVSRARSAEFLLPPALAAMVAAGEELGAADDRLFGRVASGRGSGTIGKLTGGVVTREQ